MKGKKHKKPAVEPFVPANDEQKNAVQSIIDFIENGDPNEFFTLEGKAGTGKTTIIQGALEGYFRQKQIIVAALSHKAKLVLAKKIQSRYGMYVVHDETIASLLGMTMDPETGKFSVSRSEIVAPPISAADIVIVDECSMVNEDALRNIMQKKPDDCVIIFAGDIGQLPPIRENHGINNDWPSPTFSTANKAKLTTRIRQGEESPILPYADLFWNNSQSNYPVVTPAGHTERISLVTHNGSIVFSKAMKAIEKTIPLYKQSVATGNHDIVRTIVYKNTTRKTINNIIRNRLFGEQAKEQYVPGDLLMFYDNYGFGSDKISNSTELQVKDVTDMKTPDAWEIFELGVSIEGKPKQLQVLKEFEMPRFIDHLQYLANIAKELPYGNERTEAWKNYYQEKERFAPVEYSYAITCHKCQGSTYDVAIVAEADIMSVAPTTNKSKSQSIYTGITRAKYLSIILDGKTDHPGELDKALSMLPTSTINEEISTDQKNMIKI